MELTKEYPIRRFEAGRWSSARDKVVGEVRIELDVNDGELRLAMLSLPSDLEALAVGFLASEAALRRPEDLHGVEVRGSKGQIHVRGDFDPEALENIRLRWTWGTGCGGGGTGRDFEAPAFRAVGAGPTITPPQLLKLARQFQQQTSLWQQTGGVHACALVDAGKVLLSAEDVGRHNAFDKVMGMAILRRVDPTDKIVITTGRLSAEIVSKAVACGVPILASRSAATGLAVELARRFA
ncbi:MAG: formate dehydrogenase accessory sulfurtransferase FdhD, partial [Planctomycetota bacterium]